jgi:hypothetical protein
VGPEHPDTGIPSSRQDGHLFRRDCPLVTAELLDVGPEDVETIVVTWLSGMLPAGQVANTRRSGDPLPFILVEYIDGKECVEESQVDDVVAVYRLDQKLNGDASAIRASRDGMSDVHTRMLQLARYLENIELPNGHAATVDYCDVFSRPKWSPYGDDQILRRVGEYRLGLSYAQLS